MNKKIDLIPVMPVEVLGSIVINFLGGGDFQLTQKRCLIANKILFICNYAIFIKTNLKKRI